MLSALGLGAGEVPPDAYKPWLAVAKAAKSGVIQGSSFKFKYVIPEDFREKMEARKLWIGCYKNGDGLTCMPAIRCDQMSAELYLETDSLAHGHYYVLSLKEGEVWPMITTHCTSAKVPLLPDPLVEFIQHRPPPLRSTPPPPRPTTPASASSSSSPRKPRSHTASAPRPVSPRPVSPRTASSSQAATSPRATSPRKPRSQTASSPRRALPPPEPRSSAPIRSTTSSSAPKPRLPPVPAAPKKKETKKTPPVPPPLKLKKAAPVVPPMPKKVSSSPRGSKPKRPRLPPPIVEPELNRTVTCVRKFVVKDPTTQLMCEVGQEFVIVEVDRPGWIFVRRKGKREMGIIPLQSVRYAE